jgi:hypothetical protein
MKNPCVLLLILVVILGCNENDQVANVQMQKVEIPSAKRIVEDAALDAVAAASPEDKLEEIINPKVIKNANLSFECTDIEKTYHSILEHVKKVKGTIQNDTESKSDYQISKNLTIRIPSNDFDAFISKTSKEVNYFDVKEISSDDVTEEFIDVQSRIKTKKILENRYLELLKKANKVSEMLEIEEQVSEIREEIEAKEGRLKYLNDKVSLSTIQINFYKKIAQENMVGMSFGTKIWDAIVTGFNGIISFLLLLISIWPLLLVSILSFIFIKKIIKRKSKNDN